MIVQLVNQWNIFGFKSAKVIDSELPLFPKRYWYEFWKCPNVYNLQENNVPTGHVLLSCIYGCKEKSLDLIQWGRRTIYVSFIPWTSSLSARRGIEDEMMPTECSHNLIYGCSLLTSVSKVSCPGPSQANTDRRAYERTDPAQRVDWMPKAVALRSRYSIHCSRHTARCLFFGNRATISNHSLRIFISNSFLLS